MHARGFAAAALSGPAGQLVDVRLGQNLLGWRLEAVTGDTATFSLDGEQRRLTAGAAATATTSVLH